MATLTKGKQIVAFADWKTPGENPLWGPQKPLSDTERHTWKNTEGGGIPDSPFDPDASYWVERLVPVTTSRTTGEVIYGVASAIVKGTDLTTFPLPPNGPAERQEAVPIDDAATMLAIYETVSVP